MKFEVWVEINVDPDANFLELDDEASGVLELFKESIYDMDDVELEDLYVKEIK